METSGKRRSGFSDCLMMPLQNIFFPPSAPWESVGCSGYSMWLLPIPGSCTPRKRGWPRAHYHHGCSSRRGNSFPTSLPSSGHRPRTLLFPGTLHYLPVRPWLPDCSPVPRSGARLQSHQPLCCVLDTLSSCCSARAQHSQHPSSSRPCLAVSCSVLTPRCTVYLEPG